MPHYAVIARDHPNALDRRMVARPGHVAMGDALAAEGKLVFGAAIIEQNQMVGSILIANFPDRAALQQWLDVEPYLLGDVWGQVTIEEIRVGPTFTAKFGAPA
jgi:uncharacterized protein